MRFITKPSCGKNIVSLKNVFVEAEAELIVLNLNIFLFIIQCDERESSDKHQILEGASTEPTSDVVYGY